MPLDEVAVDLYGRVPAEFVAARDELVAEATRAGDERLAAAIAALRKPTVAAWAVNLLARGASGEVTALLTLGDALRRAQRELSGAQLRELTVRRQQAVSALARRAGALATEHGKRLSENSIREVTQTLTAALADPEIADRVRTGTLSSAATYSGFGPAGPDLVAVDGGDEPRSPRGRRAGPPNGKIQGAKPSGGTRGEERREPKKGRRTSPSAETSEQARRRSGAERDLERARRELADLRGALESDSTAMESVRAEAERTERALLRCDEEIERLRAELAHAEQQRRFARTAQRSAQDELTAARRQVERAERRVRRAQERERESAQRAEPAD